MENIVLISNESFSTLNFRKELILELSKHFNTYVICNVRSDIGYFEKRNIIFIDSKFDFKGKNPFEDCRLLRFYYKCLKKIKPKIVLTFTIKPNIYGGLVCKKLRIKQIANVTGLGHAKNQSNILHLMVKTLYKISFKSIDHVFFQNLDDFYYAKKIGIQCRSSSIINGSGVNLSRFKYSDVSSSKIVFLFMSRIIEEKGVLYFSRASKIIKKKYPSVIFKIYGEGDDECIKKLNFENDGSYEYFGRADDSKEEIANCTAVFLPSYYPEGVPNILLEACASGRLIVTTNNVGCKEVIRDNVNGFVVEEKSVNSIVNIMEKIINLSYEDKICLGKNGRKIVEERFDRKKIINNYFDYINKEIG